MDLRENESLEAGPGLFVTERAGTAYRQIKKCYEIFEISM